MAIRDWNGNGDKNDSFDNYMDYQCYKDCTKNLKKNNNGGPSSNGGGCGCLMYVVAFVIFGYLLNAFNELGEDILMTFKSFFGWEYNNESIENMRCVLMIIAVAYFFYYMNWSNNKKEAVRIMENDIKFKREKGILISDNVSYKDYTNYISLRLFSAFIIDICGIIVFIKDLFYNWDLIDIMYYYEEEYGVSIYDRIQGDIICLVGFVMLFVVLFIHRKKQKSMKFKGKK